jgi:hypothetical protein
MMGTLCYSEEEVNLVRWKRSEFIEMQESCPLFDVLL